jgi:hypothetical protein
LQLRAEDTIETDNEKPLVARSKIRSTRTLRKVLMEQVARKSAIHSRISARNAQSAETPRRFDERISEKRINHRRLMSEKCQSTRGKSASKPRGNVRFRLHARSHSREDPRETSGVPRFPASARDVSMCAACVPRTMRNVSN